jgi:PAS domain S-box-containing protein
MDPYEFLESIEDGFVALDESYTAVYANAAARGAPAGLEAALQEQCRRARETGGAVQAEHHDASAQRWYELRAWPARDGFWAGFRDITVWKRTAGVLEAVVEHAPAGIAVLRPPDFVYELANPAYRALAPSKPMLGRTVAEVWPEMASDVVPSLEEVVRTGRPWSGTDVRLPIQRAAGGRIEEGWFTFTCVPLPAAGGGPPSLLGMVVETTAHVQARRRVEELLERSKLMLAGMSEGLILAGPDGVILDMNQAALRLLGFRLAGEARGDLLELHGPDGRRLEHHERPLVRLARGEEFANLIAEVRRVDGGAPWIASYNGAVVRDAGGAVALAVLTFRDITALRGAEEALRLSEEGLRLAAEGAGAGMWSRNLDTGEILWSEAVRTLFGLPPDTPPTQERFLAAMHPDDRERVQRAIDRAAAGLDAFDEEYRVVWPDGSVHWLSSRGRAGAAAGGRAHAVHGIVVNIDARKRMEQYLRATTETLRAVIDCSPLAIIATDLEGRVTSWNAAAERIYGFTEAEALNRLSPSIPEDGWETARADIGRCRNGETLAGLERRRRRKDGVMIDVMLSLAPVRDSSGRIEGIVAVVADITERKRIEDELRQSQQLESLSRLAGGVAHTFNNLLTGVIGNISLALDAIPSGGHSAVELDEALRSAERAATLARQMLAYSGRSRFVVGPADLSEIARGTCALIQDSVAKGISVRQEMPDEGPVIRADASQIQQLVTNLVLNAVEAIGDGGGDVVVATGEQNGFAWLEVRDTGAGMDRETMTRIWEPFFTTKFTGRGLGLAAVQGIVRGHGGTIEVESEPGRGSRFRVLLPMEESQSGPAPLTAGSGDSP